jgi:hypothetical protein
MNGCGDSGEAWNWLVKPGSHRSAAVPPPRWRSLTSTINSLTGAPTATCAQARRLARSQERCLFPLRWPRTRPHHSCRPFTHQSSCPTFDQVSDSTSIDGVHFSAIVFALLTRIEIPHRSFEHLRLWMEEGPAGSGTDRKISRRFETPEIDRVSTWTFQRFSAPMDVRATQGE